MSTIDELTTRIAVLRHEQDYLHDQQVSDLADITIILARLHTIRAHAHHIAAQLRTMGALDLADKAVRGWAQCDPDDEDDFDRWCEEQRDKQACRLHGYQCGLCRTCRRNGIDALA